MMLRLIAAMWLCWGGYWTIASRIAKPTVRREATWSQLTHMAFAGAGVLILLRPKMLGTTLAAPLVPPHAVWPIAGAALVFAGLALAVWARVRLGGNWSSSVTMKAGHELVRTGPYGVVRHPIYAGLLLAVAGTGLAINRLSCIGAMALIAAAATLKIQVEERFMREAFGSEYADYARRTARLVPFVW